MNLRDFVKAVRSTAVRQAVREPETPKGWFTVGQIREALGVTYDRNASSRARELWRRGMLDRLQVKTQCPSGSVHKGYVYRPRKPYRTIQEANLMALNHCADKVPKGYVRVIDYAVTARMSDVAIRSRIERSRLRATYYRTPRGIAGLHRNAYYRKTDLDRICA
jgi:hypothetical protein